MINISGYPIFNINMSTLKDTSIDKRDNTIIYMTNSILPAVSFDKVKDDYVKKLGLEIVPMSNDALFVDKAGNITFIEFKNGYIDKTKQFSIRKKIYDSILIFTDIVSIGISAMRQFIEYILVYNETENPGVIADEKKHVQSSTSFDAFAKSMGNLANVEYVAFGINIFKKYCFKDVHTFTQNEFEDFLKK